MVAVVVIWLTIKKIRHQASSRLSCDAEPFAGESLPELESGPQRELAKAALVVVAPKGEGAEATFQLTDCQWGGGCTAIVEIGFICVVVVVVENVESLGAELEPDALRDLECFAGGQVTVPRPRPSERIAPAHISRKRPQIRDAQFRVKGCETGRKRNRQASEEVLSLIHI